MKEQFDTATEPTKLHVMYMFDALTRASRCLLSSIGQVLTYPLHYTYVNGPPLGSYGFWGGAPQHQICASLTSIYPEHWLEHRDECDDLITRRVHGIVALVVLVFYVGTWTMLYCRCMTRLMSALY
jgi:hypothetical protein